MQYNEIQTLSKALELLMSLKAYKLKELKQVYPEASKMDIYRALVLVRRRGLKLVETKNGLKALKRGHN